LVSRHKKRVTGSGMNLPPSISSRASLNRWPTTMGAIAAPEMAVLNILHFAGSVAGVVPDRHVASVCMRVPKHHTSCGAAPQTHRLRANRSRQRKHCEPCGDYTARFFSLFALISPTSRDTKNTQWYLHKNKTRQKLEGTKGMVNSNIERKRILLVEDQEDAWEIAAHNLGEHAH